MALASLTPTMLHPKSIVIRFDVASDDESMWNIAAAYSSNFPCTRCLPPIHFQMAMFARTDQEPVRAPTRANYSCSQRQFVLCRLIRRQPSGVGADDRSGAAQISCRRCEAIARGQPHQQLWGVRQARRLTRVSLLAFLLFVCCYTPCEV